MRIPLRAAAGLVVLTLLSCTENFDPQIADVSVRLASYNVFLRDTKGETVGLFPPSDPRCRAGAIEAVLNESDYDFVGLQEGFDTGLTQGLGKGLETNYPNQLFGQPERCSAPNGECRTTNGGLALFGGRRSRVEGPIVATFDACDSEEGEDCLAAKGMALWPAFVRTEAEQDVGIFLNVVTLHLDSGNNPASTAARRAQLEQLRGFLETHVCDTGRRLWPLAITGDFNVHHEGPPDSASAVNAEYLDARDRLRPRCSQPAQDLYLEARKSWALDDAEAGTTTCEGSRLLPSCTPPVPTSRRIDYLWLLNPLDGRAQGQVETAQTRPFAGGDCEPAFLSDHKLVEATVRLTSLP